MGGDVTGRCAEGKNDRECSWCVFMKSGPCYKSFSQWQGCVKDVGTGAVNHS